MIRYRIRQCAAAALAAVFLTGCAAKESRQAMAIEKETAIAEKETEAKRVVLNVKQELPSVHVEETKEEPENPKEVSLVFAGDILFDESYAIMASMRQRGTGIEGSISSGLLKIMREADIFMVNNEFPYTNRGTPTPGKKFTFRAKPESASFLKEMGADAVSLANNHAYDYGETGLLDSMDVLNAMEIPFAGAGRNLEEARKPVCFPFGNQKIAVIAATQIERLTPPDTKGATEESAGVFRCLEIAKLLETIREAKEVNDFVIVFIHWGTESTDQLDHWQREQAPQIADAGADLIIGAHPHVLQPVGYCNDVPVVYSLGNFLFNSRSLDSCLVRVVLNQDGLKSLQFIPARQEGCRVFLAEGKEKERILQYMRKISPEAAFDEEGYITKAQ